MIGVRSLHERDRGRRRGSGHGSVTRYTLAAAMAGLATLASIASVVVGHAQPRPPLAMTTFFESKWPSRPSWSPDGRFVSFLWTDWAGQDLYVADRSGGAPIQLTKTGDFVGGSTWNSSGGFGVWSPDSRSIVYSIDGDLYLVSVPGGETTRLTETERRRGRRPLLTRRRPPGLRPRRQRCTSSS